MKGIILKDFEVRRLASAGIVLIWRRVNFAYKPEGDEQFIRMQPGFPDGSTRAIFEGFCSEDPFSVKCPHGRTGETRFVKETWRSWDEEQRIIYKADYQPIEMKMRWKSPASMPTEASRFRVTLSVSCRQIQSVTEEEAERSGITKENVTVGANCNGGVHVEEHGIRCFSPTEDQEFEHFDSAFISLIESSNPGSWESNSWFWAIEAKEVK